MVDIHFSFFLLFSFPFFFFFYSGLEKYLHWFQRLDCMGWFTGYLIFHEHISYFQFIIFFEYLVVLLIRPEDAILKFYNLNLCKFKVEQIYLGGSLGTTEARMTPISMSSSSQYRGIQYTHSEAPRLTEESE